MYKWPVGFNNEQVDKYQGFSSYHMFLLTTCLICRLFPGDGQTSTLDSANQSQTTGPIHPFHPKITIRRGVLSSECSEIMQQFFQLRRKNQKPQLPPRAHQGHHHPIKFFSKMHNMFGRSFCM